MKHSAEQGYWAGQLDYGEYLLYHGRYTEAMEYFKKALLQGVPAVSVFLEECERSLKTSKF